jgi:hypothetical protein
LLVAMK